MNIYQRFKNLWELSLYKIDTTHELLDKRFKTLTKDYSINKPKKLATIIQEPKEDIFKQENDNTSQ